MRFRHGASDGVDLEDGRRRGAAGLVGRRDDHLHARIVGGRPQLDPLRDGHRFGRAGGVLCWQGHKHFALLDGICLCPRFIQLLHVSREPVRLRDDRSRRWRGAGTHR